jgi:hypothetical protein
LQILTPQGKRIRVMGSRKETIETKGHEPLLDVFHLLEIQTTDAYSSLDLTNVIYNVSIHSRDEKCKVIIIIIIIM